MKLLIRNLASATTEAEVRATAWSSHAIW